MQMDDVKNSEYIEEEDIKKSTYEQRQQMFFNSRIIADESVKFMFHLDGGTGGGSQIKHKATGVGLLNNSNLT